MKFISIILIYSCLMSFFSCNRNSENVQQSNVESYLAAREPVSNYDFYILANSADTSLVKNDIKKLLDIEKLTYVPNHKINVYQKWTID